jgi:hypothetical protein
MCKFFNNCPINSEFGAPIVEPFAGEFDLHSLKKTCLL